LVFEAAAVDGNRHAGTHGRVGEVVYAVPEKPELVFRVNVLMQDLAPRICDDPAPLRRPRTFATPRLCFMLFLRWTRSNQALAELHSKHAYRLLLGQVQLWFAATTPAILLE
jgi:hypothetical protein